MGKAKRERLKDKLAERRSAKEMKIEAQANTNVYQLKLKMMQEDNLTWDEVNEKCETEVFYSYWTKYQYYFTFMVKDPIHMKQHMDEFYDSLTPEEKQYHKDHGKSASQAAEDAMNEAKKRAKT